MARLKLGLQLGYWGAGPPANAPELVAEAERLGFDSVWTAEAYGSDALTPLAWWGSRTDARPPRHRPVPALGAHAHGHGHGGADPRPPVRRTTRPGPRRVGPPGRRGLVRPALPQAAGPHARVRLDRPPGHRPGGAGHQRRAPLSPAVPGGHGTGQAAQAHRPPAAQRHPHRPRGRGPEERGAGGGDRRWLVPDLLLPRPHGRVLDGTRRRLRPARRPAPVRGLRGDRLLSRRGRRRRRAAPPISTGPCWRCTSGGWAPRR